MNKTVDFWLDRLDRLITILRPKAYNLIARSVVGLGIGLVLESQLNIVKVIIVALYESIFGDSAYLREVIGSSTSPWIGVFLILSGIIYHYLVTVGKEQIALKLSLVPKIPDLKVSILNADGETYSNDNIDFRGHIVVVPNDEDIPEFKKYKNTSQMEVLSSALNNLGMLDWNPNYYKDRAEFLKVWGGSELIALKIDNNSDFLVSGVKIEVKLPRRKEVSAVNTNTSLPLLPSEENSDRFGAIPHFSSRAAAHYDIKKGGNSNSSYIFEWDVGDIQANISKTSESLIFLRSEVSIDFELTVFCDQFPAPITKVYHLERNGIPLSISVEELKLNDNDFSRLVSQCVMDGFIERELEKKYEAFAHENLKFLPRD